MNVVRYGVQSCAVAMVLLATSAALAAEPGWRLEYSEDFESKTWADRWEIAGAAAGQTPGRLVSGGHEMRAQPKRTFKHPAVRVEVDARMTAKGPGGRVSDLAVGIGGSAARCYFQLGAEFNSMTRIAFPKMPHAATRAQLIEIGKPYRLVAELNGRVATFAVNGKRLVAALLPAAPDPKKSVMLYTWTGTAVFDNLRVYVKDKADPPPADIKAPTRGPRTTPQTLKHLRDIPLPPAPEPKPCAVRRKRIRLRLDSPGTKRGPWPVTLGVPFPRGTLWQADNVRVLDASGREVPSQRSVRATWTRAGAVKWLWVDFQADSAAKADAYALEFGREVKAAKVSAPVKVREEAGTIAVDTGVLRVTVPRESGRLFESVWLDSNGNGAYDKPEQIVRPGPGAAAYFVTAKGERYSTDAVDEENSALVEYHGPMRVVVRKRGWYKNAKGERACFFTHRLYFYRGSSHVRLFTTWTCTRDTTDFTFRDMGLRLPLAVRSPVATLGADKGAWRRAKSLKRPAAAVQAGRHQAYLRMDAAKAPAGDLDGWVDLSDGRHGASVAVYDMAEQSPTSLELDAQGITFHAFTSEPGPILDFSVAHLRKLWGEKVWDRFERGRGIEPPLMGRPTNGCGVSKTHEIVIRFHRAEPPQSTAAFCAAVQRPPVVSSDPIWNCATDAFGPYHPRDARNFSAQERQIEKAFETFLDVVDRLEPRYDFWDYGMGMPHHISYRPGKAKIPYSGYRREYDCGYGNPIAPWLLFLRSGDRRYLHYGTQFSRHIMDWHIEHWTHPRLGLVIGWCTADLGTWPFDRHTTSFTFNNWGEHLLLDYYVTGYERAMDVMLEMMDSHYERHIKTNRPNTYCGATGNWLGNCALMYQATWEKRYYDAFKMYEAVQMGAWEPYSGGFAERSGETFYPERRLPGTPRSGWRLYGQFHADRTPGADPMSAVALARFGKFDLRPGGYFFGGRPAYGGHSFAHWAAWQRYRDPRFVKFAQIRMQELAERGTSFTSFAGLAIARHLPVWMKLALEPVRRPVVVPLKQQTDRIETMPAFLVHLKGTPTTATVFQAPAIIAPDGENVTADVVSTNPVYREYAILVPKGRPSGAYEVRPARSKEPNVWKPYSAMKIVAPPGTGVMFGARNGVLLRGRSVWFHVPLGLRAFRVSARSEAVRFQAVPPKGKPIALKGPLAEVRVPPGAHGTWEIRKSQTHGACFLILHDVPAYVSFRPASVKPIDTGLRAELQRADASDAMWVEGAFRGSGGPNKALRLCGRRRLGIPLGKLTKSGGRERLLNTQGTFEFLVRLNRAPELCPGGLPFLVNLAKGVKVTQWFRSFLSLEYKNGVMMGDGFRGNKIAGFGPWDTSIGPTTLAARRWYHVAVQWKLDDGKGKMYRRVYLNGVPVDYAYYEAHSWGPNALKPVPIAERLILNAAQRDVTVDELRISDAPRYEDKQPFKPSSKPYALDKHTLLLVHFDGNMAPAKP